MRLGGISRMIEIAHQSTRLAGDLGSGRDRRGHNAGELEDIHQIDYGITAVTW